METFASLVTEDTLKEKNTGMLSTLKGKNMLSEQILFF